MKSFLLCITLTLFLGACNNSKENTSQRETRKDTIPSNSDDNAVRDILNKYREYTIKENFEGIVSLVSSDLFVEVSKEELIKGLKEGMHNDKYDLAITEIVFDPISKVVEKDGDKYARAQSTTQSTLVVKQKEVFSEYCSGTKKAKSWGYLRRGEEIHKF